MEDEYKIENHKMMYHPCRVCDWMEGKEIFPIIVEICPIGKCNHRCIFCISGDSKIMMSNFTERKIRDIKIGDEILGFDELKPKSGHCKKVYPSRVLNTFKRRAKTIKITLKNEKELIVTSNHRILSNRGQKENAWREAGKFKVGQEIRINPYIPEESGKIDKDYKIGYLIGMILGDGLFKSYQREKQMDYRFRIALSDEEPIHRIYDYLTNTFNVKCHYIDFDIHRKKDKSLYKPAISARSKESYHKIKDIIDSNYGCNLTYDYARGFLSGIYDAEGHIDKENRTIRVSNTNRDLINEIKNCLDIINIPYTIESQKNKERKDMYIVRIISPINEFNHLAFLQIINPAIKRKGIKNFHNIRMSDSEEIIKIEEWKEIDVYNIQTESKTYIANGFCVHNCAYNYTNYDGPAIDYDVMTRALDDMGINDVKVTEWDVEGEPLLHPKLADLINYSAKLGMDNALETNGVLFTKSFSEKCLHNLSYVKVSIDAATPETHQKLHRGKKSDLENIFKNLRDAVNLNTDCVIGTQLLLLKENEHEAQQLADIVEDIGVDYFAIKPFSKHPLQDDSLVHPGDFNKVKNIKNALIRDITNERLEIKRGYDKCYGINFFTNIDCYGNVCLCNTLTRKNEYNFGNIYNDSFENIWKNRPYREYDSTNCRMICRMDKQNKYLWELKHPPKHVNFI